MANVVCDPQSRKINFTETRKLWLVGVATDRGAPLACPNVNNLRKMKRNASIKNKKRKNENKRMSEKR